MKLKTQLFSLLVFFMVHFSSSLSLADIPSDAKKGNSSSTSEVEKFLVENLTVEDPNRFILTSKLKAKLERGFEESEDSAFNSDGSITAEGEAALEGIFSEQSAKVLERIILALGRSSYSNSMLVGQAGVGKTFLLNQLVAILSFGVLPDFLQNEFGSEANLSKFIEDLREQYFRNTQIVSIDYDLLSRDNTRAGKAFAKADVRMRTILTDIFVAAKKDYRETGLRTIFVLEEVATLPPLVQQTLKTLLDDTGFVGQTNDPLKKGAEVGYSVIGATTPGEYRDMVDADSAVERRYDLTFLLEPSDQEALEILIKKKEEWIDRYELLIDDNVLAYIISMRNFFGNPPLAMPHSVLKVVDGLLLWASNPGNRKHGEEITIAEAYAYLIQQAHLPVETWMPSEEGKPPLWDLADRVKQHVIGHDGIVDGVTQRIKTGRSTGFREVPVFIIMGPSGSGKDTLAKALNIELFGHEGSHLSFGVAHGSGIGAVLEGGSIGRSERELPLLLKAMNEKEPNGVIVLNEVKDMPSNEFDKLKTIVEDGVIRPRGRDSRERPLGLNAIFLMGQYGEELFDGKSDAEADEIANGLTEEDLVKILEQGQDNGKRGAMPWSLIQRAIRSGGVYILKPVAKNNYTDIVRINLANIVDNIKLKNNLAAIEVDESVVEYVADLAVANNKGTRGLDGLLKVLTETAHMEAVDQGLPERDVSIKMSVDETRQVLVQEVNPEDSSEVIAAYPIPAKLLLRGKCEDLLIDED